MIPVNLIFIIIKIDVIYYIYPEKGSGGEKRVETGAPAQIARAKVLESTVLLDKKGDGPRAPRGDEHLPLLLARAPVTIVREKLGAGANIAPAPVIVARSVVHQSVIIAEVVGTALIIKSK